MDIMGPQISGISDSGAIASAWDMFGGTMAINTTNGTITFLGGGNNQRPTGPGGHVISNDENGGFIWDSVNGKRQIGDVDNYCYPMSVNSRGQVVGYAYQTAVNQGRAFLWDSVNGLQILGTLGGSDSFAWQITDTMIVGTSAVADGSTHVFYAKLDGGKPDLQVTGFTITPDPKKTPASSKGKGKGSEKESDDDSKNAKTATIKVFVANKGTGAAVASSTTLADGKKVFATLATPTIPAGQSVTLTYSWDLKKVEEGKHTLTATADSAAVVTETNEANNTLKVVFTVKED
jgi:probable HAF family extracellular repeat protein